LIAETDDLEALNLYLLKWNNVCDIDVTPVLDDDEAYATTKKFLAERK
jgi:hypothetical protein